MNKILLFACLLMNTAAFSAITVTTVNAPSVTGSPLTGFSVSVNLSGAKTGVGSASAQLRLYLSRTRDGSTGVILLDDRQILLRGSGLGPYLPNSMENIFVRRFNIPNNSVPAIENTCLDGAWYILARVDDGNIGSSSVMTFTESGPDFSFSNATAPTTVLQGGVVTASFDMNTLCAANTASAIGVLFSNVNDINSASLIGRFNVAPGFGVSTNGSQIGLVNIPAGFPVGTYYVFLFADVDGTVNERNEGNNGIVIAVQVIQASNSAARNVNLEIKEPSFVSSNLTGLVDADQKYTQAISRINVSKQKPELMLKGSIATVNFHDNNEKGGVFIYSMNGKVLNHIERKSDKEVQFSLPAEKGVYVIRSVSGKAVSTHKVFVK